jgi:hypothetical protein
MLMEPFIYQVTQNQVGREDVGDFLRKAIAKQFDGKEYYIAKEELVERPTYYSKTPRKLRGYMINENNTVGHAIWFDITDIKTVTWVG